MDKFDSSQSAGLKGELDIVHPHDACILIRVSASTNHVLCLLNRSDFSSGVLAEV